MSATEARTMVRRKELFQRYARDAGLDADQLAVRLMLSPARILDLLCGRAPISNELATHIEEMLQLPASWLDQGGALEPGDPPMIDVLSPAPNVAPPQGPSQGPAQAPNAASNPASTAAPTTTAEALPAAAVPAARLPAAGAGAAATAVADKKQRHEHRRLNLTMLTTERGSKNRLAQLAGTSGSRISLMTSARKPVSDPFAFAIEDGLGLPRGWLDQPRSPDSVPAAVWQSLQVDSAAATAGAAAIAAGTAAGTAGTTAGTTAGAAVGAAVGGTVGGTVGAASAGSTATANARATAGRPRQGKSAAVARHAASAPAVAEYAASAPAASPLATGPSAVLGAPATPALSAAIGAPTTQSLSASAATPGVQAPSLAFSAPGADVYTGTTGRPAATPAVAAVSTAGTGLFDKPTGQCGPIAEALAKTILNLSATDKLSESRAFQLLGVLLSETSPPV
ncbi:hypothetical protein [Thauera phenylacetica]|uniref:hypothetical protein n=1 Tax=Thauera phenylacetica TaxID=164400 RepID=UPI0039E67FB1